MKKGGTLRQAQRSELEGWKVEKLGDVCETRAGGTPLKSHKEYYVGGKIPWLLSGEVSQGEIYESKNFITEKGLKNSSATVFPSNTVLIAMYGATAGQVGILKFECSTNQAVCGIYPNKNLLPKFLYYCFLSKKDDLISQAVGGAQPNISQLKIKNTFIPVPPLPEQQRIVSVLDEAFASIAQAKSNAERNLVNARELFEAAQRELFEGVGNKKSEVTMLGNVATFRNGINFTKASKGETVKIVGVKDFQNYFWVPLDNLDSVTIDGKLNETDYLRKGDILVVRSNGNQQLIGRSILASHVTEKTTHSGFTIRIRFESKDIFPEYLCHYLKSEKARKQLISGGAGISIKSLNQTTLSELPISLPPLAEQRAIVGRLEALSAETKRLEEIYQSKVESLEELKKSVLGKAFSGEV